MLRLIICDDDMGFCIQERQSIDAIMKDKFSYISYDLDICNTGNELYDKMKEAPVDVIFLDIEVGEENGFEIAKTIKSQSPMVNIVFITTHDNLVYGSFQYKPLGFVRKQYFELEFSDLMERIVRELVSTNKLVVIGELKDKKTYMVEEIQMITSCGHYLIVKSKDGENQVRASFSKISKILENKGFVIINKGLIINANYVNYVEGGDVITNDNEKLQIKRGCYKEVRQKISEEKVKDR